MSYLFRISLISALSLLLAACTTLEDMKQSTVRVVCRQGNNISAGSGFVVGRGQHVATNWHVVGCTAKGGMVGILLAPEQAVQGRVVWKSPQHDLAIVELARPLDRPPVTFALSEHVQDDEEVRALAFPGAADEGMDEQSLFKVKVTQGVISAHVRSEQGTRLYHIDAPVNPGNSGGPLFNATGQVIGIYVMKSLALVPAVQFDAQGNPQMTAERVPLGEGIAWAVRVEELLPGLEALNLPYDASGPGHFAPLVRLWGHDPIVAVALLLTTLLAVAALVSSRRGRGIVQQAMTRSRQVLARRRAPAAAPGLKTARPVLRCLTGPFAGGMIELGEEPVALGRDPHQSQLVFPQEAIDISRRHASVRYAPAARVFYVEDCGSANGTFLAAGERLEPGRLQALPPGSRFYLGNTGFMFQVDMETTP